MSPLSFTPAVVEAVRDPSPTKAATIKQLIDLFDRKQVRLISATTPTKVTALEKC